MQGLAAERARLLAADPEPERPGRDPDELERQAAELRAEEAGLTERLTEGREALAESVAERTMAEGALAAAERRLADAARAAAGRAERLARLRGMVDAAASRAAATGEEIDRLTAAAEQARARAERARQEYSQVQDVADDGDSDRSGLAAELEKAQRDTTSIQNGSLLRVKPNAPPTARWPPSGPAPTRSTRPCGRASTRRPRCSPTRTASAASSALSPPSSTVADGYQKAIAAALGAAAEALTVNGLDAAVEVLTGIRSANAGTVGLVIADPSATQPAPRAAASCSGRRRAQRRLPVSRRPRSRLPRGARWAADLVTAPAELSGAVAGAARRRRGGRGPGAGGRDRSG